LAKISAGLTTRLSGCDSFQPLQHRRFGLHADHTVQLSPFVEEQQGRIALDAEARRRGWIPLYIEFRHAHPARQLRASSSITGTTIRQGPHQGTLISSSTRSGEASTSDANVPSVTVTGLLLTGRAVLHRLHTG
jgi:hypothetical protein